VGPLLLLAGLFTGSLMVVAGLNAAVAGHLHFSLDALAWKPDKLNIVSGMQKFISGRAWVGTSLAVLKLSIAAVVAAILVPSLLPGIAAAARTGLPGLLQAMGSAMLEAGLVLGGLLFGVAMIEAAHSRYRTEQDLKMTRQEAVEDARETDGNPLIKRRSRSLHRKLAKRRMVQAVAASDVVLANPTHVAVALAYKRGRMRAPKVMAKGADLMAERIKAVAREHGVPVMEQPPLARALYKTSQVGREIPGHLYRAVAKILTQVYREKHGGSRGRRR
jgi:flagellar biosynthetic protein FlhB